MKNRGQETYLVDTKMPGQDEEIAALEQEKKESWRTQNQIQEEGARVHLPLALHLIFLLVFRLAVVVVL